MRRDFLKVLSAGVGGLLVGLPASGGCRRSRTGAGDALFDAFRSPSAEARPFFRWWWNGNRVTREELIRELRLMHAVGAGGVEINPIGMHEAIADPSGRAIEWLSDEWTGLVAAVVEEAERLGLVTDLIVGTGWPFGGEFLSDEETIQGVELEVVGVEPAVRLDPVDDRLFFVQHRHGARDIFFIANVSRDRDIDFTATFGAPGKTAWRWDPETGERSVYGTGRSLPVSLGALESLLLVFEPAAGEPAAERPTPLGGPSREIAGPWAVRLECMDGHVEERTLDTLADLSRLEGLEAFSGTAVYATTFEAPAGAEAWLDLGDVRETSEVTLNGEPLGVRWYGRHRYDVSGRLRPGGNELEITVTTLAFNHYRAQRDNPMAQYWMSRSRQEGPLSAGLLGPVRLLPASR